MFQLYLQLSSLSLVANKTSPNVIFAKQHCVMDGEDLTISSRVNWKLFKAVNEFRSISWRDVQSFK